MAKEVYCRHCKRELDSSQSQKPNVYTCQVCGGITRISEPKESPLESKTPLFAGLE